MSCMSFFDVRRRGSDHSAEWSFTASSRAGFRPRNRSSTAAGLSRLSAIICTRASPPRITSNALVSMPSTMAAATAEAADDEVQPRRTRVRLLARTAHADSLSSGSGAARWREISLGQFRTARRDDAHDAVMVVGAHCSGLSISGISSSANGLGSILLERLARPLGPLTL
jgi:hypothetical protein